MKGEPAPNRIGDSQIPAHTGLNKKKKKPALSGGRLELLLLFHAMLYLFSTCMNLLIDGIATAAFESIALKAMYETVIPAENSALS